MSLHAYPAVAPAFVNHGFPSSDASHSEYPAPYHNAGPVPAVFAGGSSLRADHLEHPQCPPRYFHARSTQLGPPSAPAPRYSGTSSSATAARYATGVSISGYGAAPAYASRPAGGTWARDAPASADDVQGLAVHGHASEGLDALRYSAAAAASFSAPSLSMSPSSASGSGSSVFKSAEGPVLASPTPQVPLPPQMAILLNNSAEETQRDGSYGDSAQPSAFDHLRMPLAYAVVYPDMSEPATVRELEEDADAIEEGFLSREKKHGCTMCHKRFDRPSTLKKHLLVHTGEKAFQCSICERRFGVMSNLNRHIRRCSLREVHTHHGSGASSQAAAAALPEKVASVSPRKRGRTPPAADAANPTASASAPRKRRRRPPSPTRWIPPSLRSFIIPSPEVVAAVNVPLAPVSPSRARPLYTRSGPDAVTEGGPLWDEERDSYDENIGRAPYHPSEWEKTHRLPGPGVVAKFGGGVSGNYSSDSDFGDRARIRGRTVRV
ncbi:hypothetical protein C8R43DRAFT_1177092 [Mycena crocata]|nr:hypothetical protein C8R43DRAFT_1177092 [Mycena crocata]